MNRKYNISVVDRYLSKSKKYCSSRSVNKNKQNSVVESINQVIKNYSQVQKLPKISYAKYNRKSPLAILQVITNRNVTKVQKLGVNSINFFQQNQQQQLGKKDIKKQMLYYMKKMKQPVRSKRSLHQQYLWLCQETNDYLEYYLTNFTGQDPGKATQLLKQQGKTIILLLLRKSYKCFQSNNLEITNRIFLAFNLNPMNDFQFISWDKFMKIRKLISGDFNRKDCLDFLQKYFFINLNAKMHINEIWLIFSSVLRKLDKVLDPSHLQIFIEKTKQIFMQITSQKTQYSRQEFYKIILNQPLFVWYQFVLLTFL